MLEIWSMVLGGGCIIEMLEFSTLQQILHSEERIKRQENRTLERKCKAITFIIKDAFSHIGLMQMGIMIMFSGSLKYSFSLGIIIHDTIYTWYMNKISNPNDRQYDHLVSMKMCPCLLSTCDHSH